MERRQRPKSVSIKRKGIEEVERKKTRVIRGAAALLAVFLCVGLAGCRYRISDWISWGNLFGQNGKSDYRYEHSDRYQVGDGVCEAKIRTLDIDWVAGSVEVLTHEGDSIEFYEESSQTISEEYRMRYLVDGDTLKIKYCESGRWDWKDRSKQLTVLIPEDMPLDRICVDTASGEVFISQVDAKEVEVNGVSGDVSLTDVRNMKTVKAEVVSSRVTVVTEEKLDSAAVETVSGGVDITAGGVDSFEITTVSGTVCVAVAQESKCDGEIETVSGGVTVRLPEEAGYRIDYSSVSGTFSSELECTVNGERYERGDGGCRIEVDTVSGNLEVGNYVG